MELILEIIIMILLFISMIYLNYSIFKQLSELAKEPKNIRPTSWILMCVMASTNVSLLLGVLLSHFTLTL